ncbi:MAG: serine hydrolase domain-containing protein [Acidimicrobiia bacterium]
MTATGSATDALTDLRRWLDEQAEVASLYHGVQVFAEQGGVPVFEHAAGIDGEGNPMAADRIGMVRCALVKPAIAITIASLVEQGAMRYEDTVADLLDAPMHAEVAALPVWTLLAHRAGVHDLGGDFLTVFPPEKRRAIVRLSPLAPGFVPGDEFGYSEAAGGVVLGEIIEAVTGRAYHEVLDELIVGPAGAGDDLFVRFDDERYDRLQHRIGVNAWMDSDPRTPYLLERSRLFATDWNPGFGGYATARGLVAMYRLFLDVLAERRVVAGVSRQAIEEIRAPLPRPTNLPDDVTLVYSYGFNHGFSSLGVPDHRVDHAFGHSGYGTAFAFADSSLDLAVGIRYTGHTDEVAHKYLRLGRVIEHIYEAVDPEVGS